MSEVKVTGEVVMEGVLKRLFQQMVDKELAIKEETCVKCKKDASQFKDELSVKEYAISGWCQVCQDEFFE